MPQFKSLSDRQKSNPFYGRTGDLGYGTDELTSDQKEQQILKAREQNAGAIRGPEFDSDEGIDYTYAGDLNPEAYATPEEAQYSLADDSAEGRSAQLAALQHMAELTDQSAGSQMALGRNQAELDARQLANSREGAIRQDAMRRGQLGSTADMLSRQQAAQAGANQNLNAGLQNAQQAALMQLAGTQAGSSMAGQLRGQDQAMAFNNSDTINRFNMANTGARNQTRNANTDLMNGAQGRNLDARQGLADRQTGLAMTKLGRSDTNKQTTFGNQMTQYGAMDDVLASKQGQIGTAEERRRRDRGEVGSTIKDIAKTAGSVVGGL
jgi:hypothetical protein